MYLHMYTKGQEAERQEQADRVSDMAHASPSRVSIPELMQQLQVTQDELENIRVSLVCPTRVVRGTAFPTTHIHTHLQNPYLNICPCDANVWMMLGWVRPMEELSLPVPGLH